MFWEPAESSLLDASSSDGLAAMHAARQHAAALAATASNTASQPLDNDEESYTRGVCLSVCLLHWQLLPVTLHHSRLIMTKRATHEVCVCLSVCYTGSYCQQHGITAA